MDCLFYLSMSICLSIFGTADFNLEERVHSFSDMLKNDRKKPFFKKPEMTIMTIAPWNVIDQAMSKPSLLFLLVHAIWALTLLCLLSKRAPHATGVAVLSSSNALLQFFLAIPVGQHVTCPEGSIPWEFRWLVLSQYRRQVSCVPLSLPPAWTVPSLYLQNSAVAVRWADFVCS